MGMTGKAKLAIERRAKKEENSPGGELELVCVDDDKLSVVALSTHSDMH
jgi:hypothetical protein